jgi:hypothetical protein
LCARRMQMASPGSSSSSGSEKRAGRLRSTQVWLAAHVCCMLDEQSSLHSSSACIVLQCVDRCWRMRVHPGGV